MLLKRISLFLAAFLSLGIGLLACGGVTVNVNDTPTPVATVQVQAPTPASNAQSSGLQTRAPPPNQNAESTQSDAKVNGFQTIAYNSLPPEAKETLALIKANGPFPYRQDGQIFQNREGILPKKQSGYYHEYTVETPGSDDRGARRIISGSQGELYYTADHYTSFKVIVTNE